MSRFFYVWPGNDSPRSRAASYLVLVNGDEVLVLYDPGLRSTTAWEWGAKDSDESMNVTIGPDDEGYDLLEAFVAGLTLMGWAPGVEMDVPYHLDALTACL